MTKRFARTELLLGQNAMEKLRRATVAVVGLGAVGSYATEGLARAGIGNLRLVDFDEIRETNINRQLYALDSTIGKPKVEIARNRVLDINPSCRVECLPLFVDKTTVGTILEKPLDIVIDAIDSLGPKVELIAATREAGIEIISAMGAATRTDFSMIRVSDISKTKICPLARLVRKRLRQRNVESGVSCIYSTEPPDPMEDHEETGPELTEKDFLERGRIRKPLGSLSCLTGIFGLIAAREAIMKIAAK